MNKLTQKDDCGNWGLMDYEGTELTPEEVERVNDFDRSQSGIMLKKLNEEQRKHRWIPVSERLPESDDFVLTTVSGKFRNIRFENALQTASYDGKEWIVEGYPEWETPDVTAWQTLPEPYKPERGEEK